MRLVAMKSPTEDFQAVDDALQTINSEFHDTLSCTGVQADVEKVRWHSTIVARNLSLQGAKQCFVVHILPCRTVAGASQGNDLG